MSGVAEDLSGYISNIMLNLQRFHLGGELSGDLCGITTGVKWQHCEK